MGVGGRLVDADHRRRPQPEPGRGQGGVGHAAAQPPAARIVGRQVATGRSDVQDLDRGARSSASVPPGRNRTRSYTGGPIHPHDGVDVFFYELHEGDNEVFTDVLVVSESEWEPDEFFELVQTIRRRIQDTYVHDTLSEAIAVELERDHGFIYVSDDRLVAAVNVSTDEDENFLATTEVELADAAEDEDDDDDRSRARTSTKARRSTTVIAEFDPRSGRLN